MLYWYFYWPDEEPGVGPQPGQSEEEGEAEGERDPGAGRRGGEGPGEGDCPGEVGDQQHLDQQKDAGAAQGAVQPASVKAVQVRHRDNKGGHAEDTQYQQLPGPEPVMDRCSYSAAGGHTWSWRSQLSLQSTAITLTDIKKRQS